MSIPKRPVADAPEGRVAVIDIGSMQLTYELSGGMPSILRQAALQFEQGSLQLRAPSTLTGEPVVRDLASLTKAVDSGPVD